MLWIVLGTQECSHFVCVPSLVLNFHVGYSNNNPAFLSCVHIYFHEKIVGFSGERTMGHCEAEKWLRCKALAMQSWGSELEPQHPLKYISQAQSIHLQYPSGGGDR